jgi:hypothetical protein
MAKEMSDKMGQSYKNAERLIRTETTISTTKPKRPLIGPPASKNMNMSQHWTAAQAKYAPAWTGTLPHFGSTSGTNFPPMHPNCRSTTIEYDPDDALDWFNSGKKMPKNMTYSEWAEANGIKRKKSSDSKRNQVITVD